MPPTEESRLATSPNCPIAELLSHYQRDGDVVQYKTKRNSFYVLSDPIDVKHVLLSENYVRSPLVKSVLGEGLLVADGPHWERQRRLLLPGFKPHYTEQFIDLFREVTESRVDHWLGAPDAGSLNLCREMDRIALTNVSRALFGADVDDRFLDAFALVMRQLGQIGNAAIFGFPIIRGAEDNRSFRRAMEVIEHDVETIISKARTRTSNRGILMDLMLSRADSGELTFRQIRDEVLTMLTAGHETTAVTLSWAWYSVLTNADVRERFYQEVHDVLGTRPIEAADLGRLRYTRMIVDETLRMYPPIWLVARVALRDDSTGRIPIPASAGVLISPFLIHRRPQSWPQPEQFRPERFALGTDGAEELGYLPFLGGRHICLGKFFALAETVTVLATVAQRCRFERIDRHAMEFDPLLSLRMSGPFRVNVEA